jgi:probable rRNA maturation factor
VIQLQVRPYYRGQICETSLISAAETVLNECQHEEVVVGILITGDTEIRQLNLQYRQIDSPTDVLSFNGDYIDPDSGINYLGDIIISVPRAKKQAITAGHTLAQELELIVIHGVLHLCGFDHDTNKHQQKMWSIQADILNRINNPLSGNFRVNTD